MYICISLSLYIYIYIYILKRTPNSRQDGMELRFRGKDLANEGCASDFLEAAPVI